jgi:hypothetical protein
LRGDPVAVAAASGNVASVNAQSVADWYRPPSGVAAGKHVGANPVVQHATTIVNNGAVVRGLQQHNTRSDCRKRNCSYGKTRAYKGSWHRCGEPGAATPGTAARDFASLVAEAALGAGMSLPIMRQLLRSGVVTGGGRESGRLGAGVAVRAREGRAAWRPSWLSVVQRREIRLLGRDRNFMVQTLLMPLLIVGLQSLFGMRKLHLAGVDPRNLMAAAFGVAAYALMFSAFQVLNSEGQALWILFTLPRRLVSARLPRDVVGRSSRNGGL